MTKSDRPLIGEGVADPDLDALVDQILAGHCPEEGWAELPGDLCERVRGDLLSGMQDPRVRLRARIAAGRALGQLGDPRFKPEERSGVRFTEPPLVRVPAGIYPIGSSPEDSQASDHERPRHQVPIDEFRIGRYPVTVGEYRCFVEVGGYGQAHYWETEDARVWLGGQDPAGGPTGRILGLRQRLLDSGRSLEDWAEENDWKPETLQNWQKWTSMSEAEVRQDLRSIIPEHSRREPAWWNDPALTGSNQPVVGVTWYEARAYCAWLANAAGRAFRLPTEVEWEAAMRSQDGRRYPWGHRFDPARANTLEGRVMGTTPVGSYPGGVSPFGAWDGAGNVWEWTSSIDRPYPYRSEDGREDGSSAEKRVLRGGSWFSPKSHCRCALRDVTIPDLFSYYVGFRVVSTNTPLSGP